MDTTTQFGSRLRRAQSGFTLIEIMIVVVILGILAAIAVPRIMSRPDEARIVRTQQDLRAISAALDLYKLDNFTYPGTEQGLDALVSRPSGTAESSRWREGGYLAALPTDPWGGAYMYLQPGEHGPFDVYSFGADGVPGGEGANADIGSWKLN